MQVEAANSTIAAGIGHGRKSCRGVHSE